MGRIATLPGAMAVVRCPSLPAAINTEKGEDKRGGRKRKKGNLGGRFFFLRKRGTNRGAKFWRRTENRGGRTENRGESLFERRGARAKQKKKEEKGEMRVKEQDRRGRRRATVAPPSAPPSLLPATTDSTIIVQK
jgi:hypothetical protein